MVGPRISWSLNNFFILSLSFCLSFFINPVYSQKLKENPDVDKKVRELLGSSRFRWRDMNIPESDGRILYDIIIENNYKNNIN